MSDSCILNENLLSAGLFRYSLNIFHFKPPGSHTIYLCIQNTQTVYPVLFNGVIKALILTDEVMQSLLTGKDVAE